MHPTLRFRPSVCGSIPGWLLLIHCHTQGLCIHSPSVIGCRCVFNVCTCGACACVCVCIYGEAFIDKGTLISAHKFDVTFSDTPTHSVAAARDRHSNTTTVRPNEREREIKWSSVNLFEKSFLLIK